MTRFTTKTNDERITELWHQLEITEIEMERSRDAVIAAAHAVIHITDVRDDLINEIKTLLDRRRTPRQRQQSHRPDLALAADHQGDTIAMVHSHLCPICKRAYNCTGKECAPYNGVVHPDCNMRHTPPRHPDAITRSVRPILDNAPHNKESA